VKNFTSI